MVKLDQQVLLVVLVARERQGQEVRRALLALRVQLEELVEQVQLVTQDQQAQWV